ncbi:uncharacterized protein UDID_17045 [Ustilago sp. UG-2017a]|nr:uncharacterized protein UDID_17045 [Ustilago sp. UG-2017a]
MDRSVWPNTSIGHPDDWPDTSRYRHSPPTLSSRKSTVLPRDECSTCIHVNDDFEKLLQDFGRDMAQSIPKESMERAVGRMAEFRKGKLILVQSLDLPKGNDTAFMPFIRQILLTADDLPPKLDGPTGVRSALAKPFTATARAYKRCAPAQMDDRPSKLQVRAIVGIESRRVGAPYLCRSVFDKVHANLFSFTNTRLSPYASSLASAVIALAVSTVSTASRAN